MTEEGQEGRNAFNQKRQPTSANLNGIHNARFAGLPLADPMDAGVVLRGRRLKTRDGLFIRLQE